jgi:ABC-type branched-subunit amino acid transport system substrate-binding protein
MAPARPLFGQGYAVSQNFAHRVRLRGNTLAARICAGRVRSAAVLRAVFAAACLVCAAPPALAAAGDIVIGQVVDQSGLNLEASRDYVAGAKTYFDYANSQGGVNGHHLTLLVKDDGGDAERTLEQTRELIEKDRVQVLFGYIGDGSVRMVASSNVFRNSGISLVGALTGDDIGGAGDSLYFLRASYRNEVDRVVAYFGNLGIRRFGMVRLSTPFAEGAQRALRRDVAAKSLDLYGDAVMASDGRDAARAAREIFNKHPQVIVIFGDTIAVGNFVRAYRPLDQGGFLVALSTVNHTALQQIIGSALANGLLLTQVVPSPINFGVEVVRDHAVMMRRFREEPPSHLTLEGFLAAKALVEALRGAGREVSRQAISTQLRQHRHYDLDGVSLNFTDGSNRGSSLVDLTLLRGDGSLLH